MAETMQEPVIMLPDSSSFPRNKCTLNQQIKKAMSTFRPAGAGIGNHKKTIHLRAPTQSVHDGPEVHPAISHTTGAGGCEDMLKVSYDHRQKQPAPEQIKACLEDLCFEVKATFFACEGDRNILGKTGSATITAKQNSERYQEEYEDTSAEITMPGHWIKDLQKAMRSVAAAVSKARTDPYNVTPP